MKEPYLAEGSKGAETTTLATPEWTLRLKPDSTGQLPKGRQLYLALYQAIAEGDLYYGLLLPSTRALSQQLGLGRNTVINAYAQLETEGLIASNGRRGTRITYTSAKPIATEAEKRTKLPATSARLRKIPMGTSAFNDLAPGMPDPSLFPAASWRRSLSKAAQLPAEDLGYDPQPLPQLQQAIARHLSIYRSLHVDAERILVTSSTRQSLLVTAMLYADPKDEAWIESPGYTGAVEAFTAAGLSLIPLCVDKSGALTRKKKKQTTPAIIYLTPCFQYPTGVALTLQRRYAFLEYAARTRSVIFEDDYDSEFRDMSEARPALAAQCLTSAGCPAITSLSDEHANAETHSPDATVLHAGTFSKLIFPAARVAWLVLPADHVERGQACLRAIGGGHNRVAQAAVAELLENGTVGRHLQTARRIYAQRRQCLIASLSTSSWFEPIPQNGGSLSLVVSLTTAVPHSLFVQLCLKQRLGLKTLNDYHWQSPRSKRVTDLVLGVGNISTLHIPEAITRLENVLEICASGVVPSAV